MNEPDHPPAPLAPGASDQLARLHGDDPAHPVDLAEPGALATVDNLGMTDLATLADRSAFYAARARAQNTQRVYRSAWRGYEVWCRSHGKNPLSGDPGLIAMFATWRADQDVAVSTLRVDLAAIRTAHLLAGITLDLRDPRLVMVLEGFSRARGTRPARRATPAVPAVLQKLLGACRTPADAIGARDRAMLLLGFGAALRRSELTALSVGDVEPAQGRGLRLLVRRSKTDQHGAGQEIVVWANPATPLLCPAAALESWLAHRRVAPDLDWSVADTVRRNAPLFCAVTKAGRATGAGLSDKAVVRLIKRAALHAGLDDPDRYSGHSLRAGLATAAGDSGASLHDLMRQTRHKSAQVAMGYLRPADLWRNNVTEGLLGPTEETAKNPLT